ncbi:hypothetical protein IEO21_08283 [Rhodonia placenta]|uniref:Uncharacterized protein n=1 Tax=Rhodonia placenta TaxID=104341 RepID=A0A8H7NWF1_9APHY|nr:hypothetical protein IEO21_08283 [Postia placenta]
MTPRDVRTARDCPLRASLRSWTNAPPRRRTVVPTLVDGLYSCISQVKVCIEICSYFCRAHHSPILQRHLNGLYTPTRSSI